MTRPRATGVGSSTRAESTAAHDQIPRQADLCTKIYNLLTAEQRTRLAPLIQQCQAMQQRHAATPAVWH